MSATEWVLKFLPSSLIAVSDLLTSQRCRPSASDSSALLKLLVPEALVSCKISMWVPEAVIYENSHTVSTPIPIAVYTTPA